MSWAHCKKHRCIGRVDGAISGMRHWILCVASPGQARFWVLIRKMSGILWQRQQAAWLIQQVNAQGEHRTAMSLVQGVFPHVCPRLPRPQTSVPIVLLSLEAYPLFIALYTNLTTNLSPSLSAVGNFLGKNHRQFGRPFANCHSGAFPLLLPPGVDYSLWSSENRFGSDCWYRKFKVPCHCVLVKR